jgi:molybdenum cofactor biosynthesis enzyme
VAAVATATPALAADPAALEAAMARLASATATQQTAPFEASAAQSERQAAGDALTGQPLAGAGNAQVTAALSALCHLQLSAAG